ncbi:MAG: hypothetical protein AAB421_02550 [Patescibacteria group bacterium]
MINAEVIKAGNENTLSLLRKFSRKVQGTGLVRRVRAGRYNARAESKVTTKKRALKRITRNELNKQLIKEGKMTEKPARGERGANPAKK